MKIALASLNQYWENKDKNKTICLSYIETSAYYDVDLIIFPEMTLTGFSMNTSQIAEDYQNSNTIKWFKEKAKQYHINIAFGVVLKSNKKARNHLILMSKNGEVLVNYAKIHPFSFSSEDKYYEAGDEIKCIELEGTNIGFSICYDLRFPEIFQALSKKCELLINIANWPKSRIHHWKVLLNARAIENQVFMVGVNRTGIDGNNIEYEKSSMIFDPNGNLIEPIFSKDSLDVFRIDPSIVREIRSSFPIKNDRKPDFYKSVL